MSYLVKHSNSNMVLFDLSGRHRHLTTHRAYLETLFVKDPGTFVLCVDLRYPEGIDNELYYWSSMIDDVCHSHNSSIIVMGTYHNESENINAAYEKLKIIASAFTNHHVIKVVKLNVAEIHHTEEFNLFLALLYKTNADTIKHSLQMSTLCLGLYNCIRHISPHCSAISVADFISTLQAKTMAQVCREIIINQLKFLSNKGLIILTYSFFDDVIVLDKNDFLKEVNDIISIFSKSHQKNIGKFSTQDLDSKYKTSIINYLLQHGICMNVTPILRGPYVRELYFPAFVPAETLRDTKINDEHRFVWLSKVAEGYKYFSLRLCDVLRLRLFGKFYYTPSRRNPNLCCNVWSRGIEWTTEEGQRVVVEMKKFQSVSLSTTMRKIDPGYVRSIIDTIRSSCDEFCPHVNRIEAIIFPPKFVRFETESNRNLKLQCEIPMNTSRLRKALDTIELKVKVSVDEHYLMSQLKALGLETSEQELQIFVNLQEWMPQLKLILGDYGE